ncbi:MAG: hypothetical protein R3C15_19950 [Thermoleophilia bacterium]
MRRLAERRPTPEEALEQLWTGRPPRRRLFRLPSPDPPDAPVGWLARRASGDALMGYRPTAFPAAGWLLHAMYEWLPGVDEVVAAPLGPGATFHRTPTGVDLRTLHPGEGWVRLHWAELARRLDVDLSPLTTAEYVSVFTFGHWAWPDSVRAPGEGGLDRAQLARLVDHLASVSPRGLGEPCGAFYCGAWWQHDPDPFAGAAFEGTLGDVLALHDDPATPGPPTNLWPLDHEGWVAYADPDGWGTQVAGSPDLLGRLAADPELELVRIVSRAGARQRPR